MVEMMGLEPTTPCLQSQIGHDRYLRGLSAMQVEAAVALSVAIPWGPVRTAVNGTVVARPARTTFVRAWQSGHQLDRRVRLAHGHTCLVGKGRRPAAQVRWGSNPVQCCCTVRGRSGGRPVTCDSYLPAVTARACRGPAVPDVVRPSADRNP